MPPRAVFVFANCEPDAEILHINVTPGRVKVFRMKKASRNPLDLVGGVFFRNDEYGVDPITQKSVLRRSVWEPVELPPTRPVSACKVRAARSGAHAAEPGCPLCRIEQQCASCELAAEHMPGIPDDPPEYLDLVVTTAKEVEQETYEESKTFVATRFQERMVAKAPRSAAALAAEHDKYQISALSELARRQAEERAKLDKQWDG